MESSSLARTYARAYYSLIEKEYTQARETLSYISAVIAESHDTRKFLGHPSFLNEEKVKFIEAVVGRKLGIVMERLLFVLIDKKRVNLLDGILIELEKLYSQQHNFKFVQVVSAAALSTEQRKRIADAVAYWIGKKVEVEFEVDSTKIAGFVIKDGDRVLDNTLLSELKAVKETLLNA